VNSADVRETWVHCTFDSPWPTDAPALEARIRREVRTDRMRLAERAGRCESLLHDHDDIPMAHAMADAWDELLPLIQAPTPDEIAIERVTRRLGDVWRRER
jgi:hypothetical protein